MNDHSRTTVLDQIENDPAFKEFVLQETEKLRHGNVRESIAALQDAIEPIPYGPLSFSDFSAQTVQQLLNVFEDAIHAEEFNRLTLAFQKAGFILFSGYLINMRHHFEE